MDEAFKEAYLENIRMINDSKLVDSYFRQTQEQQETINIMISIIKYLIDQSGGEVKIPYEYIGHKEYPGSLEKDIDSANMMMVLKLIKEDD